MTDIRVPTLGESVTEATIGKWFKQPGDAVAVDEPLVELETDKVTIEVPAPAAGVLGEIAAKDGETVAVGALLGQIQDGAAAKAATEGPAAAGREAGRRAATPAAAKARGRRHAARPLGAQARGRERRRCRDRAGLRQGRPRHQGRHDGGDRARRRGADARSPSRPPPCRCARRRRPTMRRARSA